MVRELEVISSVPVVRQCADQFAHRVVAVPEHSEVRIVVVPKRDVENVREVSHRVLVIFAKSLKLLTDFADLLCHALSMTHMDIA